MSAETPTAQEVADLAAVGCLRQGKKSRVGTRCLYRGSTEAIKEWLSDAADSAGGEGHRR